MSARHTPGPWSVIDNSWEVSTVYGPDGETVAECPINSIVTEDTQFEHEAVKEANARFIVHAVNCHDDLLAAAIYAVQQLADGDEADIDSDGDEICPFERLCAAIAKARGEVA